MDPLVAAASVLAAALAIGLAAVGPGTTSLDPSRGAAPGIQDIQKPWN